MPNITNVLQSPGLVKPLETWSFVKVNFKDFFISPIFVDFKVGKLNQSLAKVLIDVRNFLIGCYFDLVSYERDDSQYINTRLNGRLKCNAIDPMTKLLLCLRASRLQAIYSKDWPIQACRCHRLYFELS